MTVDRTLMPGGGSHGDAFLRNSPTHVEALVLGANSAEARAVPFGATMVLFSASGDFYAKPNGPAAVPAGDITDGSGSELNPTQWDLDGVSSLGLVSGTANVVTMTFYTGPGSTSGTLHPLTLPSLVDWFDSIDGSSVLGVDPASEVESWVGQAGALVLTNSQGTGPLYQERSGKSVLYFNNGPRLDVSLPGFASGNWAEGPYEVWTVLEPTSGSGRFLYDFSNSADADTELSFNYATSNGSSTAAWRNDAGAFARRDPTATGIFPAQPVIFRQWQTAAGLVNAEVLPDRLSGPTGGPADPITIDHLTVGASSAGGSTAIGYFSALLIFDDALAEGEAATLASFLRARYGAL